MTDYNTEPTDITHTKTLKVKDNRATGHTLMVTQVHPIEGSPMSNEGFRSDGFMFTVVAGGTVESHYDPYKLFGGSSVLSREGHTASLCKAIHHDHSIFNKLEDGQVVEPDDLESLEDG